MKTLPVKKMKKKLALAFNVFLYFLEFVNLNIFNLEISKKKALILISTILKFPAQNTLNKFVIIMFFELNFIINGI